MTQSPGTSNERTVFYLTGLAVSLLMLVRSQVGIDQLNLLSRGWALSRLGEWIHYGNPTSAGGMAPGGITSLLVGLPLFVWNDHRAATLLIWLTHIIAYAILDRIVARAAGPRERYLFAALYWLSPWRLYYSSFLWNPNYLFLLGAIHMVTSFRQREKGTFVDSFIHVLTIGLAFQIHASFLLLASSSFFLWWRKFVKVNWWGVLTGAAASAALLIPWVLVVRQDPSLLPVSEGFPARGLLYVFPLLRGVTYWFRYASLFMSEKSLRFDFGAIAGDGDTLLTPLAWALVFGGGAVTLVVAFMANRALWRRARTRLAQRFSGGDRAWLSGYCRWSFVGAVAVYALAPTTVMSWQGLLLYHAAILPLALWGGALSRNTRWKHLVVPAARAWACASVLLALATAYGAPLYRCGGRSAIAYPIRRLHPIMEDLHMTDDCPWTVDRASRYDVPQFLYDAQGRPRTGR